MTHEDEYKVSRRPIYQAVFGAPYETMLAHDADIYASLCRWLEDQQQHGARGATRIVCD